MIIKSNISLGRVDNRVNSGHAIVDRDPNEQFVRLRIHEEIVEPITETVVAKPLTGGPLLSPEVLSFMLNERLKDQEYQEVTNVPVLN